MKKYYKIKNFNFHFLKKKHKAALNFDIVINEKIAVHFILNVTNLNEIL